MFRQRRSRHLLAKYRGRDGAVKASRIVALRLISVGVHGGPSEAELDAAPVLHQFADKSLSIFPMKSRGTGKISHELFKGGESRAKNT